MEKEIRINLEAVAEKTIVDDDHRWGYQLRLVNELEYCGKLLVLENGCSGSYHFHHRKRETFIVLAGTVFVYTEDEVSNPLLHPGDKVTIPVNVGHRMWAKDLPAVILEVSTHDDDDDTYRLTNDHTGTVEKTEIPGSAALIREQLLGVGDPDV